MGIWHDTSRIYGFARSVPHFKYGLTIMMIHSVPKYTPASVRYVPNRTTAPWLFQTAKPSKEPVAYSTLKNTEFIHFQRTLGRRRLMLFFLVPTIIPMARKWGEYRHRFGVGIGYDTRLEGKRMVSHAASRTCTADWPSYRTIDYVPEHTPAAVRYVETL